MDTNREAPAWAQYLRWMLVATAATIGLCGAINALVDPMGVFGSPRIPGINATKPYLDHHRELTRIVGARRICGALGIFGNSRAEIGFDPQGAVLTSITENAFNHAIPGTSSAAALRQLIWLEEAGCFPRTLIVGVEFFDFLGGSDPVEMPTRESDPPPSLDRRFFAETVFSLAGLRDSFSTVLLQRARYPATSTARGFNPLLNYVSEVEQSGHYVLFRQRAEENIRRWSKKPLRLRLPGQATSEDEQAVEWILERAAQNGAKVYLIVYPYHAQIRMMVERMGMGELFDDWKRMLIAVAARRRAAGADVEVWDFSGVSHRTLEPIPSRGDRKAHLEHYWEAGHFKKELGEQLLARVLNGAGDFGFRLDSGDAEPRLAEDRRRVRSLLIDPSPLRDEVDSLFTAAANR